MSDDPALGAAGISPACVAGRCVDCWADWLDDAAEAMRDCDHHCHEPESDWTMPSLGVTDEPDVLSLDGVRLERDADGDWAQRIEVRWPTARPGESAPPLSRPGLSREEWEALGAEYRRALDGHLTAWQDAFAFALTVDVEPALAALREVNDELALTFHDLRSQLQWLPRGRRLQPHLRQVQIVASQLRREHWTEDPAASVVHAAYDRRRRARRRRNRR